MTPTGVDLRCSAVVFRAQAVLLVQRLGEGRDDWVLPGGYPRPGETTAACARREVYEETGLRVDPSRCAFVLETIDPARTQRTIEVVFLATEDSPRSAPEPLEDGLQPAFVPLDDLAGLHLRPPLAGHLRSLADPRRRQTAAYLGNLWRPARSDRVGSGGGLAPPAEP